MPIRCQVEFEMLLIYLLRLYILCEYNSMFTCLLKCLNLELIKLSMYLYVYIFSINKYYNYLKSV